MKKILLIIIMFFISGCYDYKEVNNLAFISTIGIDYYNDNYEITYEILTNNKDDNNESINNTITISSTGKSLSEVFDNIALKVAKKPYFYHLKAIVINKDCAIYKLKEITDYVIRSNDIRNEFYMFLTNKNSSKDLLNNTNNENAVADQLEMLISANNSSAYNKPFMDILENLNSYSKTAIITSCSLDNNNIKIDGISILKDYKYIKNLDINESSLINIILNNKNNLLLENDNEIINIYNSKVKYKYTSNTLDINIYSDAEIKENSSYKLNETNSYEILNKKFNNIYKDKLNNLINKLIKNDIDILNIKNKYYKKYHKNIDLNDLKININTKLNINKKGLIFDTNEK